MLLPLAIPFLVVFRLSFQIKIYNFYCFLLSCTLGPLNNKLLKCTYFSLELHEFFGTAPFVSKYTFRKSLRACVQGRSHRRCAGVGSAAPHHLACRQICSTSVVLIDVVLLRKRKGSLLCRQLWFAGSLLFRQIWFEGSLLFGKFGLREIFFFGKYDSREVFFFGKYDSREVFFFGKYDSREVFFVGNFASREVFFVGK